MPIKTTHHGTKLYVCATAQNDDLNQAAYEALTWVQVGKVGNAGDWGTQSSMPSYDTLDEETSQFQKGTATAGKPTVECASVANDAGQIILRTYGVPYNQNNAALKLERNDMAQGGASNTILYSRGVVDGPRYPGGGNDDFVREVYDIALNQIPIRVNAT
jgi:hypothetical protein